jgi:hypothetical protein
MARPGVVAILSRFENLSDPRVERTKQHLLLDPPSSLLPCRVLRSIRATFESFNHPPSNGTRHRTTFLYLSQCTNH